MTNRTFNKEDLVNFEKDEKVSLLATLDDNGLPHISLITTLQTTDEKHIIMGQFCEGVSKGNLRKRSKSGFLILTLDMNYWRGKLDWKKEAVSGKELDLFNMKPMWRYNTYFGIHIVHYLNVIEVFKKGKISIPSLLPGILTGKIAGLLLKRKSDKKPLNLWTVNLVNKLNTLSFLSWIDADGYPVIVPALQLTSVNNNKIIFSFHKYKEEFRSIKTGTSIAVYSLSLQMESVLLRGIFHRIKRVAGMSVGIVEIDWVYNSMPPAAGQIYPELPLEAVQVNR